MTISGLELAEELKNAIADYVETSPDNYCQNLKIRYFDAPLIGFARGDDPIFNIIKEQVGLNSMTPCEALSCSLKQNTATKEIKPEEVSVVSWVLPISSLIREKNRRRYTEPAPQWSYARNYGELFNVDLRRFVVNFLNDRGYLATAPVLMPEFKTIKDVERGGFTSTWSERHVAYSCGLGTFSLNDGLITPKGIAHRLGSVVVNAKLPQTERPYRAHMEYCLSNRGCKACINRCPAGAISQLGHNKKLCYETNYTGERAITRSRKLGFKNTGCGLCQVGVPCEDRIPVKNIAGVCAAPGTVNSYRGSNI